MALFSYSRNMQFKKMILYLVIIFSCASLFAAEPQKGMVSNGVYKYERIGWEFPIPKGWEIRQMSAVDRVRGVGKDAVELEGLPLPTPLLYLKKGGNNRFTSDALLFIPTPGISYAEQQESEFTTMVNAIKSRGIKVTTKRGQEKIDGIVFEVLKLDILSPDRKRILAKSVTYDTLLEGISFTMGYVCSESVECENIGKATEKSKFSR